MKVSKRAMLIFLASPLVVVGVVVGWLWRADPQGEENSHCDQFDRASVSNKTGMTVSTHTTVCTTLGTSIATYVYVHASGERPNPANLVLRYAQAASADPPKISWLDQQHVVVEANHASGISKREEKFGPISIIYKITSD
jgi:hypothetical protein